MENCGVVLPHAIQKQRRNAGYNITKMILCFKYTAISKEKLPGARNEWEILSRLIKMNRTYSSQQE